MTLAPLLAEMSATYNPEIEAPLYAWWEAQGYFKPRIDPAVRPFVISMPPPNVTGILHLGHALTSAVEDALIRQHRMTGQPTLWVPGTDHAGIATQAVVERELAKEGLSRHDLGREKFVERVWEWKEVYHACISEQQRRLGISCDWDRERFTMDEGLSRAVREAFVRLYDKGLIYRGAYLVNWCPRCTTAISDLEVEYEDEASNLWYVRYWTADRSSSITVATTRPETILGDTAVAVHPDDPRYRDLIGREVLLPVVGRPIPIIADEVVEREFGTGAVKVTPGHDPTDYEIGKRHNLPTINVLTDLGAMSEAAGPYGGLDRFECRKRLVADIQDLGDLVKIEDYTHSVGHCQRCHTIVEPRISTQWFVRMQPLAEPAITAVKEERIKIVPERFTKTYFDWLENIRDWCISRQLWWGHRIPVWYCDDCGQQMCLRTDPSTCTHCGSTDIRQDEDVLDTWFSSGLWPFSTLGWPDNTPDLNYFYPTSVLETGYDILFFWVVRMITLGLEMTGQVPFDAVYLHGLIRNEEGKKISKSLPDAWKYDPLYIIEQYGQDALRFSLLTGSTPGNDMKLAISRVEANRNFCNKIWQAARFILMSLGDNPGRYTAPERLDPSPEMNLADRWMLTRYHRLVGESERLLAAYQLGEAGRQLYEILWSEFCDWYIEMCKPRLRAGGQSVDSARRVLVYVFEGLMRLLHPYMPFVTEAIWQYLPHQGDTIMLAPWPQPAGLDDNAEAQVTTLMELVRGIRNARAEYKVEPMRRVKAVFAAGASIAMLEQESDILATLARLDPDRLEIVRSLETKPAKAYTLIVGDVEAYLPLADLIDLERELARIDEETRQQEKELERAQQLLANQGFLARAPRAVVDKERDKVAVITARLVKLGELRAAIQD
ncbi:MAG: valine--tRNA ligase [Chloroflexi bacterium]|mgnify:CR=1 FL=1|nr:valine--tRNA ligase [Chloroflexota bacterium]